MLFVLVCTSLTSVQNRLFKAREKIKNKSMIKMSNQKDYSKFKKDAKSLECKQSYNFS